MHKHILKDFLQYQGRLTNIFLIPLILLNILIPLSNSLHKLLNIICAQSVTTLALGSQQRQGLAKVQAKSEARESHFMFL
jgi:hypothetical protein